MKHFITLCIASLIFTFSVFSQEKSSTHKVEKGETITQIAQKYNVTPYDIYQLNPDALTGLKPNSILLIPKIAVKSVPKTKLASGIINHVVAPKETVFGIEKKYGISDEALKKANPSIEKEGLKIGQTLVIPTLAAAKITTQKPEAVVFHEVLPKETKYSIAKLYGITIEELEKKNPEIVSNLPIGFKLIIKGIAPKIVKTVAIVESKKEIIKSNPIEIPAVQEAKKQIVTLTKTNATTFKKLAILMPFNKANIEADTINTIAIRLKKDKFLNMTLDFYAGALMAIDSAKQIGLPVDVSIFDSQETKNTSNVVALIKANNLENADAIIGPFYQTNVEKTAELLDVKQITVISPLSKDIGNSFPNLYQSIVASTTIKNAMFDFMESKKGNILAVIDKKKESSRKFIQENHAGVQFVALSEKGDFLPENLMKLFVKDKTNYVVMDTGNTSMIKWIMTTMLNAMLNYKVQLVILEPNETLDTDEIDFTNLTKLKLMYPSMTRENETPEALLFEKNFKIKNKINPSSYATRGFDITFDTMLRLSQEKTFQETVETMATEQVDNKFEYYKKADSGYTNKGVYILYYDTDLTIKQAN